MVLNLALLLVAITAPAPDKAASDPAELISALVLSNHVDAASLNRDHVREASGSGEPWRAAPGVFFSPGAPAKGNPSASPARVAKMDGGWLWIRVCSLEGGGAIEAIRRETDEAKGAETVRGVILDLRSLEDYAHFENGARIEALFMPEGGLLFSLEGKGAPQRFKAEEPARFVLPPMAVIVDEHTAGVAEAMAESLRSLKRAVIFGAPTAGRLAEYGAVALPSGRLLRVPSRRVRLGDGGRAFHEPVQPDIAVNRNETDEEMLRREAQEGPAVFMAEEKPRPRQNEAALVRGENPELEEAIRLRLEASNGKEDKSPEKGKDAGKQGKDEAKAPDASAKAADREPAGDKPEKAVRDEALQRAVDFLKSLDALGMNRVAGPGAVTNAGPVAPGGKAAP